MEDFTFSLPTVVHFGRGGENAVGTLTKNCGGSRVLIHSGGNSAKKSGLLDRAKKSLTDAGLEVFELGGVEPNPKLSLCRKGIDLCRENGIDFILAIGGGSVTDSAKCIAMGAVDVGDVWDFYTGARAVPAGALPIGVICTLPAAGSENNCGSVVTNEEGSMKLGYANDVLFPRFAVLNPELTFTLPAYQTAAGAVDTIAHILNGYIDRHFENELLNAMAEGVMRTVVKYAPVAIAEPKNYEARAQLMWAASIGCNSSLLVGCRSDATSHGIEHEFSALYDVTHGAGLAVVIPAWFKYVVNDCPERFARFAHEVFGVEYDFDAPINTALEGITRLEEWEKSIGMPIRLSELNIDAERFDEIAVRTVNVVGEYGQVKTCGVKETREMLELML